MKNLYISISNAASCGLNMPSHMESAITTGRWIIQYPAGNSTILIIVVQAVGITKLQVVWESSFYSVGFYGFSTITKNKSQDKTLFSKFRKRVANLSGHSWTETGLPIAMLEPKFNSLHFWSSTCFDFHQIESDKTTSIYNVSTRVLSKK